MNSPFSEESHKEETFLEPLSPLQKNQIMRESLAAAAKKGGAIVLRGECGSTTSDPHGSLALEGMLMRVSSQSTKHAQILHYQSLGFSECEIIKAIWRVEDRDSPEYRQAQQEYLELLHLHGSSHG